ncbi:DivIVA domain-containing protein [Fodinicola feengrottensis]|uniref:DivIVA domain-containing protein n=1 Tax=Fodinicola feengrottensis TaxID=435914 RepID=UPI0024436146|nr:DivIVA domain-containing protein [Fodinicola feengrottensis]
MVQGSDPGERFRRRALRRGYKVDEVDEFLDRVDSTLMGNPDGPPITSEEEVHNVVFRVRFGGYDEWEVDKHLDRLERQLNELDNQPVAAPARSERREPAPARAMAGSGIGGAASVAAPMAAPVAANRVPSPARAGRSGRTSIGVSGDDAPTQYVPAVRPSPYGDQGPHPDQGPDPDHFDTSPVGVPRRALPRLRTKTPRLPPTSGSE